VTIRPAGPDDLPDLADLLAGSSLLRRYGTTRPGALAALARAHAAGDALLVARAPDAPPAGLAWVIGSRILTGAAYLRLLLVADPAQRTGLGARLLAAAEAHARPSANHLVLLVTADNAGARRFYERHGYRPVGDLPSFAVPGLDEALYHKPLREPGDRLPV
jgi:GNAT superfamily N-acetyltransferase